MPFSLLLEYQKCKHSEIISHCTHTRTKQIKMETFQGKRTFDDLWIEENTPAFSINNWFCPSI